MKKNSSIKLTGTLIVAVTAVLLLIIFREKFLVTKAVTDFATDFAKGTQKLSGGEAKAPTTQNPSADPDVSQIIPPATQDLIRGCFDKNPQLPQVHYDTDLSLKKILQDLSLNQLSDPISQIVNLHVKKPNGVIQRLHVEPLNAKVNSQKRWAVGAWSVSVFNVDTENLPVPVPFPNDLKVDTLNGVTDQFSQSGTVIFKERRFHQTITENLSADVVEENDQIKELQLFFGTHSLGCAWNQLPVAARLTCKCL